MTLSTIDPTAALIVIDLQKGIVATPAAVHPTSEIIARAASLATAFRQRGLPVVLVNVTGRAPGRTENPSTRAVGQDLPADWAELVDELDAQPDDLLITKQRWGAFQGTPLDAQLRERGVTQVVLAGISTSAGVESTARSAYELGYHVVLATDAMTDTNPATHANSIERIFPRLGETASTAEILKELG